MKEGPQVVRTARLDLVAATEAHLDAELRGLACGDFAELAAILGAEVPAGWPPGVYDGDAMRFFRERLMAEGPPSVGWYGWYAIRREDERTSPLLVGSGGYFGPPSGRGVEIGYSVVESCRGQGFATEIIRALAAHAFAESPVSCVVAHTTKENVASQRALLRAGFRRVGNGAAPETARFERRREESEHCMNDISMTGTVTAASRNAAHTFSKMNQDRIVLVAGLGVDGDAHSGETIRHRSRVQRDPTQPNLRQVHLIHSELFDELRNLGHAVSAGELGENITTRGLDLLHLPAAARLHLGERAVVELTGLRTPCVQIDRFQNGLMEALLERCDDGRVAAKAGVMAIVREGGEVRPGDAIRVELPPKPHQRLEKV